MSYTTQEFIAKIGDIVCKEAKARGYKFPSAIIAQAILESRSGNSGLAKYNNFFGLKCGSKWTGKSVNMTTKEEYKAGRVTTIKDNFRVYDTVEDGIKGYFDFISSSRYAALKKATSPMDYLMKIKAAGYATSTSYVTNVYNVAIKYQLFQFDGMSNCSLFAPLPTMRKGCKGSDVAALQNVLNFLFSAKLVVDGSYGNATKQAVISFQGAAGLYKDGIYGPKSYTKLKKLLEEKDV